MPVFGLFSGKSKNGKKTAKKMSGSVMKAKKTMKKKAKTCEFC
jgi:hypothetical protein